MLALLLPLEHLLSKYTKIDRTFFKIILILCILISDFECLYKSNSYGLYPQDKVEDFLLQFIFLKIPG
jgi:hypothetical protein